MFSTECWDAAPTVIKQNNGHHVCPQNISCFVSMFPQSRNMSGIVSCNWLESAPGTTAVWLSVFQVLHPLQQRFLNLINQENFAQICQEEAVKQEIVATLEALCGIAEATQIDNVASLFSFLMDFLSSCIGLMEVYQNSPETVNLIIEVFVEVAHKQICYLGEVS